MGSEEANRGMDFSTSGSPAIIDFLFVKSIGLLLRTK